MKLIFSGGMAFDVLPKMGGKGEALAYLMRKMKKEGWLSKNVLVCGDSGNDTELFLVERVNGVIVCTEFKLFLVPLCYLISYLTFFVIKWVKDEANQVVYLL